MRYHLFFLSVLPLLFSCQGNPKADVVVKGQSVVSLPVEPAKIAGMYIGDFRGSPLSIVLGQVTSQQANGYDLHRGIRRTLSGIVDFSDNRLHLYLVEPGDSRFDGQFHLSIDTAGWRGEGTWKSFVTGKEIPFRFQKRDISNDTGGRVFVDEAANYLVLNNDGTCLFRFQKDTAAAAPMLAVNGRYTQEKGKVMVRWENKSVFPSGRSVYQLMSEKAMKDEGFTQQTLRGEGRIFHQLMF